MVRFYCVLPLGRETDLSLAHIWQHEIDVEYSFQHAWERFKTLSESEQKAHTIYCISLTQDDIFKLLMKASSSGIKPDNVTLNVYEVLDD